MLATSVPSHSAQALLYIVALVLFLAAGIVAWMTPLVNRAVALVGFGLAVMMIVAVWVQLAAS
jgi:hypothetical protein